MPDDDVLSRLRRAALRRAGSGLRRSVLPREPDFGGLLDLASNDYLGLRADPRVIAGAVSAARTWGPGSTGSRLVTGTTRLHAELEEALAGWLNAPAALTFSSGYLANLTTLTTLTSALAGPEPVLIVSDQRNHASLVDACRLARPAELVITRHRDPAEVRAALAGRPQRQPAIVVSDSVFSVDGAWAPVPELYQLAHDNNAVLFLDEAHAFGVIGPGGRGVAASHGLTGAPDLVRTVTLSKSLASQGGAVLGAAEVIEAVTDIGRGFIFDTGLAPPSAGAALAALRVLMAEPDRGTAALAATRRLAGLAGLAGLASAPVAAAVLAVMAGTPDQALAARARCRDLGVLAGCFRPPSVPPGTSCLRLTGRATLTGPDFARAGAALAGAAELAGVAELAGTTELAGTAGPGGVAGPATGQAGTGVPELTGTPGPGEDAR